MPPFRWWSLNCPSTKCLLFINKSFYLLLIVAETFFALSACFAEGQQDEVQLGVRDPGPSRRDLRFDNRRPRPPRPLHQREQRGPDQPDLGGSDGVLPGNLDFFSQNALA